MRILRKFFFIVYFCVFFCCLNRISSTCLVKRGRVRSRLLFWGPERSVRVHAHATCQVFIETSLAADGAGHTEGATICSRSPAKVTLPPWEGGWRETPEVVERLTRTEETETLPTSISGSWSVLKHQEPHLRGQDLLENATAICPFLWHQQKSPRLPPVCGRACPTLLLRQQCLLLFRLVCHYLRVLLSWVAGKHLRRLFINLPARALWLFNACVHLPGPKKLFGLI